MPANGNEYTPGEGGKKKKPRVRYDTIYYNSSHYRFIWVDEPEDSIKGKQNKIDFFKPKDSIQPPAGEENNFVIPASGNDSNNNLNGGGVYLLGIIFLVCVPILVIAWIYLGKINYFLRAQIAR